MRGQATLAIRKITLQPFDYFKTISNREEKRKLMITLHINKQLTDVLCLKKTKV